MDTEGLHSDSSRIPRRLDGLLNGSAYPHAVEAVEVVQTQLSWVLLAGDRAYKIKRPVRLPFVDQRSLETRRILCQEELRLNRRFAPDLYLEVCAITIADGAARIGGPGPPVEYAVVMKAFDRRDQLDQLVLSNGLRDGELARFAAWLARSHDGLPRLPQRLAAERASLMANSIAANAADCIEAGRALGSDERVRRLSAALGAEARLRAAELQRRADAGFVRECHGDLHLSNVVRLNGELCPFDCLEFDATFRWIDVAQDIAFLYADLLGYQAPRLAADFLDAYLASSGDYPACAVLRLYVADRALVRAKVLALETEAGVDSVPRHTDSLRAAHLRYLAVAENALSARNPCCVMMMGLPGSGKSWLAARVARERGAVVIRSDVERRRLAGLTAAEPTEAPIVGDRYSRASTDRVYAHLVRGAASVLEGGFDVILDANFGSRSHRAELSSLCKRIGVPLRILACHAPDTVLRHRIMGRLTQRADASEADLAVLDLQRRAREAVSADEGLNVVEVDSTSEGAVAFALAGLAAPR